MSKTNFLAPQKPVILKGPSVAALLSGKAASEIPSPARSPKPVQLESFCLPRPSPPQAGGLRQA